MTVSPVHPADFPSLVDRQTYLTRRRRHLFDPPALLCLMVGLVLLIRADLVVPPTTGGIGRPALLLGAVLGAGWLLSKGHPRLAAQGPQPLRWAAAGYLAAVLTSYAAGHLRGLPPLEVGGADRAMLATLIFLGIALVCADGLPNRARLDDVIRVLVWCGAIMGLIGLLQFAFRVNLVGMFTIPGLVSHRGEALALRDRGDALVQVASTTAHYIEFGAVMALLVPLAIHVTRFGRNRPSRQLAFAAAIVMAAAVAVSLARTGIVALFVGMLVMCLFWGWRLRFNVLALGCWLIAAMMLIRPGLLGTIRSLFMNLGDDPSIESRTEAQDVALDYFAERPWFGRGLGTFVPTLYQFIDNEWLLHLITTGLVGTAGFAAWYLTALTLAGIAYRRAERERDRDLCACLISVQVMAIVVAGTFDAMSFTTHTTVLAVLTGAAGAMWRFTHPARRDRGRPAAATPPASTG